MDQEIQDTETKQSRVQVIRHMLAYGISNFGNPFILLIILTAYASFHFMERELAIRVLSIFLLCSFVPTLLFIIINVWRGKFSNYDVSTKDQRPVFYLFSITMIGIVSVILLFYPGVHPFLRSGSISAFVLLLGSYLINIKLKSSLHTCFAVYVALAFAAMNMLAGIMLMILAFLMGWSRVVLKRHTRSEVITGACLGLVVGSIFYWYNHVFFSL